MTAASSPPPRDGEVCRERSLNSEDGYCPCVSPAGHLDPHRCLHGSRWIRPAAPSEPPAADSPTPGTERRAPVQSDREHPNGSVAWWEHEQAWQDYHRRYPSQDAETIAQRAGFSYAELVDHLGHAPTTWHVGTRRYTPPAAPSPVDTTEPPAETQQDDGRHAGIVREATDLCWKATPHKQDASGGIIAYLLPAGVVHRLLGQLQGAGYPAAFRQHPPIAARPSAELHEWQCPSCGATTRARMADAQPSADTETLADQFMSSALDNIGAFDGSNDEARDRAYVRAELVALLNGIR